MSAVPAPSHLRSYQLAAVDAVRDAYRRGRRRVLLVAPTGTGKTEMYLSIARGAIAKGNRVLVLVSQEELLEQPGRKLDALGQDWGAIQGDHWRRRPWCPIQIATVQTLSRRGTRPEAAVVICDEAHLFVADTLRKVVADYPGATILGLTATPRRLDGRGLGELFDELVIATTIEESIRDGWLTPVRTFAPSVPDLSAVAVSGGDFQRGAAARAMEKPAIVGDIVATWRRLGAGRATIGFAADIAHSERMVTAFRDAGLSAAHVDGTTPRAERAQLLEDLASGALTVLWNAQLLTLGIDVPRVSCIVMARPTLSETVYLQEGGRGLRPAPGKQDLLLLDHAGNCLRHGLLEWPREWSLDGIVRRKRDETVPGLRLPCKKCFAISPAGATACVACWEPFPKKARVVLHRPGELKEATFAEKAAAFAPEARTRALAKWMREGNERGYSPARAIVIFRKSFGANPDRLMTERARAIAEGRS